MAALGLNELKKVLVDWGLSVKILWIYPMTNFRKLITNYIYLNVGEVMADPCPYFIGS